MNRYRHIFALITLLMVISLNSCVPVASPKNNKTGAFWDIFTGSKFSNKMRTEVTTEDNSQGKVTVNTVPQKESDAKDWMFIGIGLAAGWLVPNPRFKKWSEKIRRVGDLYK